MNSTSLKTGEAGQARIRQGISIDAAAKRAHIGVRYLQAVERRGCASYALAERLSRLYQCQVTVFLPKSANKAKRGGPEIRTGDQTANRNNVTGSAAPTAVQLK